VPNACRKSGKISVPPVKVPVKARKFLLFMVAKIK